MVLGMLLAIPLWIIFFVLFLVFFFLLLWFIALIDCITSKRDPVEKLLWIIVIIIFNFLGALLYFFFRNTRMKIPSKGHSKKHLVRSKSNRILGGVCGGLGKYLDIDPVLIRLIWVIFVFLSAGSAVLIYLIAWIIIPEE
tara:strand:- start:178 stop:597 length:420 start_codon:yes stop_codon:yes gene_type:complete